MCNPWPILDFDDFYEKLCYNVDRLPAGSYPGKLKQIIVTAIVQAGIQVVCKPEPSLNYDDFI